MSTVVHHIPQHRIPADLPHRVAEPTLPSIGLWWPSLDRELKRRVVADLRAPLPVEVVEHARRVGGLVGHARGRLRLGANDLAYVEAWQRTCDFK
ncbi:hypothetical protein [Agromyces seonyuensis]|uniref:Uncharacterized protein n=1 Tax=Agromyces seonyuensis TaxID=2662446 RepID=A0A6I4NTD2_9MICO|nr:hypothetical protein [Agromyces seonyuensis]MWB97490.1 hypothetical protein [Agromyces seonyuensis]